MTDKDWQAQDDAYAIKRYREIEKDPARMKAAVDALQVIAEQAKADADASLDALYPTMAEGMVN